ncbi:hypothetical protein HK099_003851 [Clydaea vesicula]|uniref:Glycylpeptide N-tetradecanoyltransferase n=1 Tax=Clydaea vesicula TaxID=447962 RepID=A0AAD5U4D1_9FUNG|nr:hypothetical protein HK099_003851 [Clydaea vesicula]
MYSEQQIVEINFLCVHKKLRQKRLAPVLIKEITRRVNLFEIFQAVYTAGCYLPKPLCTSRYYHRNLNPKKLIDVGFSYLPRDTTMARQIKNYQVPKETFIKGFRKMEMKDCKQVLKLLNDYFKMKNLEFYPVFTLGDIKHWFLPIENVVYTYVVENPKTHLIDQFVSFYNLPSSIIKHPVHKILNAAYLFYYVPKKFDENESPREGEEDISIWEGKYLKELMKDALISAKLADFDVFNCLDILDNHLFLDELKFGRGDGSLHYYMYNYRCRNVLPEKLGLVML